MSDETYYAAYAGIGSRATPPGIQTLMTQFAIAMSTRGFVLRSGGAAGADKAFEAGAPVARREIYLPWGKPNEGEYLLDPDVYNQAEAMAGLVHPAWDKCNATVRKLHARNVCQVLGRRLDSPSMMVVYWAPEDIPNGKVQGGTATAIMIARQNNIPTYNLLFPKYQATARLIIDKEKERLAELYERRER